MKAKRYHFCLVIFELWKLFRNTFFIGFYLYVIKYGEESALFKYGRMAFVALMFFAVIYILLKWMTHKYELDDHSFHIHKGVFVKSKQTVPFSKIHNITKHTSLFHKIFNMTSIRFETSSTDEDTDIVFKVITKDEANRIEEHVANQSSEEAIHDEIEHGEQGQFVSERKIHFSPSRNELIRASFTSLSFLLFIPIVASFYSKLDDIFHIEKEAEGIVSNIINSWWIVTILSVLFILCSVIFGMIRTFLKYGKYEISSDDNRIYIHKGVLEETAFSIAKDKVQAIEIEQSLMKKILGLAEVKLTSVGSMKIGDESLDVNTLYPFLPVKQAYKIVSDLLPSYKVEEAMVRLPKKSFWVRLLKPSWIWIIATAVLFFVKPKFFQLEESWWLCSILLLVIIMIVRVLNYINSGYLLNEQFIQIKHGGLTTTLFISKRDKIIEVVVTRTLLQKLFGLSSIATTNRANPVEQNKLDDVPIEIGRDFYLWYMARRAEIHIE
ncbi:PH domain-containing protein [Virgibacillus sp. 6R]|uniref:PH domain-containing protein n=1 Tax=Metabacillus sp. 22489 TaxID=3453928 RepID=UPI0011A353E0